MAATERRVRFSGVVRGASGEAECGGWVTEVTLPGLPPDYREYRIDTLSKPMPDGEYTLSVHGTSQPVRYYGHWLSPR
jgi:hypothetical protein